MRSATAVSIGGFDGVHRGHQALVRAARVTVGAAGRVVVLTFDPHPAVVLRPGAPIRRLTVLEQRRERLREAGADEVAVLEPSTGLLAQAPAEFIGAVVERWRPSFIVEGPDFRFGRGRSGSVETLRKLEGAFGFRTVVIEPVDAPLGDQHLVRVSSTMVRWLVERGRVRDAGSLLGRPYEIHAEVIPGDRRGRGLGVPTANLDHRDYVLPADGIYAGRGRGPDACWYPAAVSIGTKPTFGSHPRVCEAHLIGYRGPVDDYGWTLHLEITAWMRDQVRYERVEDLRAQLGRDLARAEAGSTGTASRVS
jgi:riboflavin kinase/FMN adenylyltransferase